MVKFIGFTTKAGFRLNARPSATYIILTSVSPFKKN